MSTKPNKIMVVEDESILLQTICEKLRVEGIETISCSSAEQCMDYVEELVELPDIIWMDYYLEGSKNALQLLAEVRENPKWQNIPVVIVSNSASQDKINAMLALGARKYILKAENKLSDIVAVFKQMLLDIDED